MKDFLIDLFFITGAVAFIGLAIFIIIYCYMFMIEFLSYKKWFASRIIDIALDSKLKNLKKENLEKWFKHVREKHKKINEELQDEI